VEAAIAHHVCSPPGALLDDPYNLTRFVLAQEHIYARVLAELAAGRKRSHWMWFIFPQLQGLGSSATARAFAISGLQEARAYLAHPLLGERLRECTQRVNGLKALGIGEILGYPDDLKFRSCMTLFAHAAAPAEELFRAALRKYCAGEEDPLTRALLISASGTSV
jgi:uncharacterized protein (DUF1810 family)